MAGDKTHIVVVDDEPEICETIQEYLQLHGYRVTTANGGGALREIMAGKDPVALVVLDITMPGEDGLSLARFLRETTQVAIVFLSAAGEVVDRIIGLEVGADDYLAKPVDLRELLARVKAVLRRTKVIAGADSGAEGDGQLARFGKCTLNLGSHKLFDEDGNEVSLTSMEFDLLKAFAERPNRVLTRDQLLDLAHHKHWEPFDRSVDIRIARVRRKIEYDPAKPQVIKTVRGSGYIYSPGKS